MLKPDMIAGPVTFALEVKDLKAAIEWYSNTLGFEAVYIMEEIGWCEMKTPYQEILIGLSEVEEPAVRGGATLTFEVKDVESTANLLKAKGVKFEGDPYTVAEFVKLVSFYDCDGNKFMLAQSLRGP